MRSRFEGIAEGNGVSRGRRALRAAAWAAAVAGALAWAGAASAATIAVAITGQAAPDGNGTFYNISAPVLNDAGQAVFSGYLTGTTGGGSDSQGIFLGSGGALTQIARTGQAAPDANGTFSRFDTQASINNAGQAGFAASLTGTSGGSGVDDSGIFLGSGGALTQVVRAGQAAPDANGTFAASSFSVYNAQSPLNATGQVAFSASLTGTSGGSGVDDTGVFLGSGGALTQIARAGQAAPDANGTFACCFRNPELNNAGQVSFIATLTGTSGGTSDNAGIFRGSGGALTQIVRLGQAAPDANGTFAGWYDPELNNAGQVAFMATFTGTSGGTSDSQGIFRGSGGSITQIARAGQAAPDANGMFSYFSLSTSINDVGQVAFNGMLTGTSGGASDEEGIFRGSGGALTQIVRKGQAAPDANGVFSGFSAYPTLNDSGVAAFTANLAGTSGGPGVDDQGIFLGDGQEIVRVARMGDALAGSSITALVFVSNHSGQSGLNDFGQVAYDAALANGTAGIFLFTPEIHWRASGSGSWDTTNNWTLGLAPGQPHDVFVDPASYATVTGPSANTDITSLTVGSSTSNTATLRDSAGGDLAVAGALTITPHGALYQETGALSAGVTSNGGTLEQDGGMVALGSLLNTGAAYFRGGTATVAGLAENRSSLSVLTGGSLDAAGGILNEGTLSLDGTLAGAGVTNDFGASLLARGSIATGLLNDGSLQTTGLLAVTGGTANAGTIQVGLGESLHPDGGLDNSGLIDLSGGSVAGSGAVLNEAGATIQGQGAVSAPLTNGGGLVHASGGGTLVVSDLSGGNVAGGELRVDDGSTLQVHSAFASSGTVTLLGPNATLGGGTLTNTGTVRGQGRIASLSVDNQGVLRAENGQLTVAGAGSSNAGGGSLEAGSGATLFFSQGLLSNAGTIALTGGAFDNGGATLQNTGSILGRGTLRSGGITNQGMLELADGNSDVFGTVANDATLRVTNNTTTFFDPVTNGAAGTIKTTNGTARFLGGLVNNGAYLSDPADNQFTDLTLGDTGYLTGGAGDRFIVSGDFLSTSVMSDVWDTAGAELLFQGSGTHTLEYTGEDRGTSRSGYTNNFAWGTLDLEAGVSLVLEDGNATPGGAVYVDALQLAGGLGQIASITGNGLSIYYDPLAAADAYLGGQTYSLAGGGLLAPVSEPQTDFLLAMGLMGLTVAGRKRRSA